MLKFPVYQYSNKWNKTPFNPAKLNFFYGWVILLAGSVGVVMSMPGQTIGVSVFRDYLEKDLQISQLNLSIAYTVGTLFSGFLATRAGKLYDKFGARIMAPAASFVMGLALIYLVSTEYLFQKLHLENYLWLGELAKILLLMLGFFTIRFTGQGILTMVSRNMVMQWFKTRRGFANMLLGIFLAGGFSLTPKYFQHLIDKYSWQQAWLSITLFCMFGFTIFALLFFRDKPENYGLQPDGNWKLKPNKKLPKANAKNYTLTEALRTPQFWIFCLPLAMFSFYLTGQYFYVKDIFREAGWDTDKALSLFIPAAIVAVCSEVFFSYISDYIKIRYLSTVVSLTLLLSMVGILLLEKPLGFNLTFLGNGFSAGLYGLLITVVWPRKFGTKHLGAISGYALSWMVIGSALSPVFYALSNLWFQSFQPIIWLCILLTVSMLVFSILAKER